MHGHPDWSLWRSFNAVVAEGSLSGAARALGLSQPTLGRHIEALEGALGAVLFARTLTGLKPNEAALKLFEQVSKAQRALAEAEILAAGTHADLSGTVRITASSVTAAYSLPPILRILRDEFPAIAIELVPSESAENILLREVDIAVRMFRPTQLELITKKVGESAICCCAHETYLQKHGPPQKAEDLYGHELVGFDRSDILIKGARTLGYDLNREDFQLRTDSQTLLWELVKAGLGVGFGQTVLIDAAPGMQRLLPGFPIPPLEVWLTTHKELFTSRRIRAIYDRLGELLTAHYGETLELEV